MFKGTSYKQRKQKGENTFKKNKQHKNNKIVQRHNMENYMLIRTITHQCT